MQADYLARRFGVFLLIVWLAATLNFFLPRLSGQDPVRSDPAPAGVSSGATSRPASRPW